MFIDVTTSPYNAAGDGTTDDWAAFASADAATPGGTIYVPRGTYRIGANLDLYADIRFEQGAVLKPDGGFTVNLHGALDAGEFRVFDLTNPGTLVYVGKTTQLLPQWWGAAGDGSTDDSIALQAAVSAACSGTSGGGVVFLPPGVYWLEGTVTANVPAGVQVEVRGGGPGTSVLRVDTGATVQPLLVTGSGDFLGTGFSVEEKSYDTQTGNSGAATAKDGVRITSSGRVSLVDVHAFGFLQPIDVDLTTNGSDPTGDPHLDYLLLRRCVGSYGRQFGIKLTRVRYAAVEDCECAYNYLDGLKTNEWCQDILVTGGRYHHNGARGSTNGQGWDCFAGGEQMTCVGTLFDYNTGGNLVVKTGNNTSWEGVAGHVRRISFVGCRFRNGVAGSGVYLDRSDADTDPTEVYPTDVRFAFCEMSGNDWWGVYNRSRGTVFEGCSIRRNGKSGVTDSGYDTTYSNCAVVANSQGSTGWFGYQISSIRCTIRGGYICGYDDALAPDDTFSGLTDYHVNPIKMFAAAADRLRVESVRFVGLTASKPPVVINSATTSTICVVDYGEVLNNPPVAFYAGSAGSTARRFGGLWVKATDATNLTGWFNGPVIARNPTTSLQPMPTGTYGTIAYDTTLGRLVAWNGSAWQAPNGDTRGNLFGTLAVSDTSTSAALTFGTAEPDTGYHVFFTVESTSGTPAAGAFSPVGTIKATSGFTLNLSAAPGTGSSVTYTWQLVR